jgi:hypothetical protein
MTTPIVPLADALTELGLTSGTQAATDAGRILNAVSAEIRRICRRGFEGSKTTYTAELYRLRGALEFNLLHTPVESITSITRVYLDGSADEAYDTTEYLLENAETGHVRLGTYYGPRAWPRHWSRDRGPDYVKVTYAATGEIPDPISNATYEWLKARYATWNERSDLAAYKTGDDSENYFASLAGLPPHNVARALALYHHNTGGGVV